MILTIGKYENSKQLKNEMKQKKRCKTCHICYINRPCQAIASVRPNSCATSNFVALGELKITLADQALAKWQLARPKWLVFSLNFI